MNNTVYQKIPIDSRGGKCILCGNKLKNSQPIKILLKDPKLNKCNIIVYRAEWCNKCDLPYLRPRDFGLIRKQYSPLFAEGCHLHSNFTVEKSKKIITKKRFFSNNRFQESPMDLNDNTYVIYVLLSVNTEMTKLKKIKITSDKKDSGKGGAYHYSTFIARKLLSLDLVLNNCGTIKIGDEEYAIHRKFINNETSLGDYVSIKHLRIKDGGGFVTHIDNRSQEIVDILLYSPYTDNYEIIKATYDSNEGELYTDICLYKKFVEEYGNPEIELYATENGKRFDNFENANSESLLKIYGYSVNQKENLSNKEREKILADVMDLNLIDQKRLLGFLTWIRSVHSSDKYFDARIKWANDINFVSNYKVNTDRFFIADIDKRR